MTNKKNRAGFTLAELLLAIAILVILFGIVFVAVTAYIKNLRLNEMNWTAKEIFIASQNQLSKAKEKGTLNTYLASHNSDEPHYVIYNGADPSDPGAWELLMPFGAIDETVRLSGKYIIEFNAKSATVTKVFYTTEAYSKGFAFSDTFYQELKTKLENNTLTKEEQKDFHGNNIIGAYGGNPESLDFVQIDDDLKLEVDNLEKLIAKISGAAASGRKVLLCIKGLSSEATTTIDVSAPLDRNYILDDVTSANMHFVNRVKSSVTGKSFIPGENIEVFVTVSAANGSGNVIFSNVIESNHVITNSLFASTDFDDSGNTAQIANFRHLENLDSLISGASYGTGSDQINLTIAEQIADLDWTAFRAKVSNNNIVNKDGKSAGVYNDISNYYPVSNIPASLTYNGNNRFIDNVSVGISNAEVGAVIQDAGLFGNIGAGKNLTVNDLELRNFNMYINPALYSGDSAGALVGKSSGTLTVTNVIAFNTKDDDSGIGIIARQNSGGLIGSAVNANVTGSAASLYVSGTGNTGGLAGNLGGGSVTNSYVGGHTVNGQFTFPGIPGYTANQQGHPNVWTTGTSGYAGGIVGTAGTGVSFTNAYTTASAYSASGTANLFVGNRADTTIPEDCYAAGWTYKDGKIVYPDLWMTDFVDNAQMLNQPSEYNYDPFWDNDYYPYKLIQNTDEVWFLKTHVGDWALPGELVDVIN